MKQGRECIVIGDFNKNCKFHLEINTNIHKPTGDRLYLDKGTTIIYQSTAPNGNVWFTTKDGTRGKTQSGSIKNMLNGGYIKPKNQ